MKKKGQGAMEYLMTYGWAILVVIIVRVILWQMGILQPRGVPTPGSSGFNNIKPKDWSCTASSGNVQVQWVNGAGEKIEASPSTGGCVYDGTTYTSGTNFNASANGIFTCTYTLHTGCTGLNSGDRFESTVTLTWAPAVGGISHTESGSVWKAAE